MTGRPEKSVLFDEPFSGKTLDRLRLLYLYYDKIEVCDHSDALAEYEADDWKKFWDPESVRQTVSKKARELGLSDRNRISALQARALTAARERQKVIAQLLARAYEPHKRYWELLRSLERQGHVRVVPAPIDAKIDPKRRTDHDARQIATNAAEGFTAWWQDYFARTVRLNLGDAGEDGRAAIVGIVVMILARHLMSAIGGQVQGRSIYSGEDGLVRVAASVTDAPTPVSIRMGETVLDIEVPRITVSEFDELAELKHRLRNLREAFQVEMTALTADLEKQPWDSDLLTELENRKRSRVDPVLFDLRRMLDEPTAHRVVRQARESLEAASGTAGIGLALAAAVGGSINTQILAGAVGASLGMIQGGISRANAERATFDTNRLAYVIRLEQRIR